MATVRPSSTSRNPLASVVDPASPLDAAESALATASLFLAHGRARDARMVLMSVWTALYLAAVESSDPARLATLSRAAREADALVTEMAPSEVPMLRVGAAGGVLGLVAGIRPCDFGRAGLTGHRPSWQSGGRGERS
ncbi:MAG: hypothetical protein EOO70_05525 [Myxococcaceae bacterium]|nr:MAG: hypothetical protein EOO70_05525 [Myxococcaceae bacterium]